MKIQEYYLIISDSGYRLMTESMMLDYANKQSNITHYMGVKEARDYLSNKCNISAYPLYLETIKNKDLFKEV